MVLRTVHRTPTWILLLFAALGIGVLVLSLVGCSISCEPDAEGRGTIFGQRRGNILTDLSGALPSYSSVVLADSPAAYWRMADGTTTGAWPDVTSNGHNFASANTGGGVGPSLVVGDASSFRTNSLGYGTTTQIDETADFSLEWWIQIPTLLGSNGFKISPLALAGGVGTNVNYFNDTPRLAVTGTDRIVDTSAVSAATTYHQVVTRAGSTLTIYRNGVADTTATFSGTMSVSQYAFNTTSVGDAIYSNIAIYPAALSASRVLLHYDIGAGITPPDMSVLPDLTVVDFTVPPDLSAFPTNLHLDTTAHTGGTATGIGVASPAGSWTNFSSPTIHSRTNDGNHFVLVEIACDGSPDPFGSGISGGGIGSWTLWKDNKSTAGDYGTQAWEGYASNIDLNAAITFTSHATSSSQNCNMLISVINGVPSTEAGTKGATAGFIDNVGTPTNAVVTINAGATKSWLFVACSNANGNAAFTAAANTTPWDYHAERTSDEYAFSRFKDTNVTRATTATGNVTLGTTGNTAPNKDSFCSCTGVEVKSL